MKCIEVDALSRDYGGGKGVFELSFSIPEGEVFGFLGPNGAGKTTTIRHLMGYLHPQRGRCRINNLDCWQDAPEIQRSLGYIPGEISFFGDMKAGEYLDFMRRYRRLGEVDRTKKLIELFELDITGRIRRMSKGNKQKLAIVAAFMHDPAILVLDEPTSGLDPLMQNRFIDLVLEEKGRGKTILMSSHMFEEVSRTCDRIAMIKDGRLVALEDTGKMISYHMKSYTVTLEDEDTAAEFAKDFNGSRDPGDLKRVTVRSSCNLEDIFLHYYKEGK